MSGILTVFSWLFLNFSSALKMSKNFLNGYWLTNIRSAQTNSKDDKSETTDLYFQNGFHEGSAAERTQ